MYTVDYFIAKFEAIPDQLWAVRNLGTEGGPRCALGHCALGNDITKESCGLISLLPNAMNINNGDDHSYPQPSPKQRILAALYDIKRMQNPEQPEPAKKEYRVIKVSESLFDHNLIEAN